jgi:hypothetical protein
VDEEFSQLALQQLEEADTLLFGRATYQMMAGYWPPPLPSIRATHPCQLESCGDEAARTAARRRHLASVISPTDRPVVTTMDWWTASTK